MSEHVVVVGGGMVAHRFVRGPARPGHRVGLPRSTSSGRSPGPPYDRVALTAFFSGRDPEDLALGTPGLWRGPGVDACAPPRGGRRPGRRGRSPPPTADRPGYDAPGARHRLLDVACHRCRARDLPGHFVYRTVDDVAELRDWVQRRAAELGRPVRGAVVGGGLLGLEAAGALRRSGVDTTVVEFAPRLMALQVDDGGGQALRRIIEGMGVDVRLRSASESIDADADGRVAALRLADQEDALPVDVVVFATGARPRDELAGRPAC